MNGVSNALSESLLKHEEASAAVVTQTGASLAGFTQAFEQSSSSLVADVSARMNGVSDELRICVDKIADKLGDSLHKHEEASAALVTATIASLDGFAERIEARSTNLLEGVASRLESTSASLADAWRGALSEQQRAGEQLAAHHGRALNAATERLEQHSVSLLRSVEEAHSKLEAQLASRNDARLTAWTDALGAMAATLRDQWQKTNAFVERRQQDICETLAGTAREMTEASRAHAQSVIAEVERVMQSAAEAPKAAAEVVAEMRQKLSDSMVRDTAMLEERSRLLATLETLLDAVNHASTEQRTAVDALVATSADVLARAGTQFTDNVRAESERIGAVAAQVTGSAVEVASLGEAFGAAVQSFGASNETLVAQLHRIEAALDKTLARSDEQLAYYVAQAREVVDLSVMSQKQIVEDLQRIAAQRELDGARA